MKIYEIDLKILKMYLHIKNVLSRSRLSDVEVRAFNSDRDRCN